MAEVFFSESQNTIAASKVGHAWGAVQQHTNHIFSCTDILLSNRPEAKCIGIPVLKNVNISKVL